MGSEQTCFSERERTRAIPEADDLSSLFDLPVVEMALVIARMIGSESAVEKAFSGFGWAELMRMC
jgi:hypothetical protein